MGTYGTFKSRVQAEAEDSGTVITATEILTWTNDGCRDFALATKCLRDEQVTNTVVGQGSYAAPDRTTEVLGVMFDDGTYSPKALAPMEHMELRYKQQGASTNSTPTHFSVFGDGAMGCAIWLYPKPDVVASLDYWRYYYPAPLTAASDTMPFSSLHDDALSFYVRARAYEKMGDPQARDFDTLYQRECDETRLEVLRANAGGGVTEPVTVW